MSRNSNVTNCTSKVGNLVANYRYDAFGNTLAASGNYASLNKYRFSTKPIDSEISSTQLYYYGYRFYSADLGRFISRDPMFEVIGEIPELTQGANLYAFVQNSSINSFDLFGLAGRVICNRCKENPSGPMTCITVQDGKITNEAFPSNTGVNNPPIKPGKYDLLPKPDRQMDRENRNLSDNHPRNADGKVNGTGGKPEYPRGTPSITHPSRHNNPGQAYPNKPHLNNHRSHGPGTSHGCMASCKAKEVKELMDRNLNKGGTTYEVNEVSCKNKCDPPAPTL
jgi:RHS repeat-associated protein